jgi:hypothetical protein
MSFPDKLPKSFPERMKVMSHAARLVLSRLPVPADLISKTLDETPYGNSVKKSIDIFKKEVGEKGFMTLIWIVTSPPYILLLMSRNTIHLRSYPSWLIEITEQFIDLLKFRSNLPLFLGPFGQIIDLCAAEDIGKAQAPSLLNAEDYIQRCNEIIERFIQYIRETEPEHDSDELVKRIKLFFKRVIDILIQFFKVNHISNMESQLRFAVKDKLHDMFPFFTKLFTMNREPEIHITFTRNINFKEWIGYGIAEKEHILRKLKEENPRKFVGYNPDDDWYYVKRYAEELDEKAEEEERLKAEAEAKEKKGGSQKKIRSRSYNNKKRSNKRCSNKRCSNKKRSNKKRSNKKRSNKKRTYKK